MLLETRTLTLLLVGRNGYSGSTCLEDLFHKEVYYYNRLNCKFRLFIIKGTNIISTLKSELCVTSVQRLLTSVRVVQ